MKQNQLLFQARPLNNLHIYIEENSVFSICLENSALSLWCTNTNRKIVGNWPASFTAATTMTTMPFSTYTKDGNTVIVCMTDDGSGDISLLRWNMGLGGQMLPTLMINEDITSSCTSYIQAGTNIIIILVADNNGNIFRWNANDNSPLPPLNLGVDGGGPYDCTTYTTQPDGKTYLFAVGTDALLNLWNLTESNLVERNFPVHPNMSDFRDYHDDDNFQFTCCSTYTVNSEVVLIAGGSDGILRRWNATDRTALEPLEGHAQANFPEFPSLRLNTRDTPGITCCATYTPPNGDIIICAGSDDNFLRFWQASNNKMISRTIRLNAKPKQIVFSKNEAIILLSNGKLVYIVLGVPTLLQLASRAAVDANVLPRTVPEEPVRIHQVIQIGPHILPKIDSKSSIPFRAQQFIRKEISPPIIIQNHNRNIRKEISPPIIIQDHNRNKRNFRSTCAQSQDPHHLGGERVAKQSRTLLCSCECHGKGDDNCGCCTF